MPHSARVSEDLTKRSRKSKGKPESSGSGRAGAKA